MFFLREVHHHLTFKTPSFLVLPPALTFFFRDLSPRLSLTFSKSLTILAA